jgi:hypothetical protein
MNYDFNDIATMLNSGVTSEEIAKNFSAQLNKASQEYEKNQRRKDLEEDIDNATSEIADEWNYLIDMLCEKDDREDNETMYVKVEDVRQFATLFLRVADMFKTLDTKTIKKPQNDGFETAMADFFTKFGI